MRDYKTLVLRKDYVPFSLFPISAINARDAVTRVVAGSCEVISNYDIRIKTPNPNTVMYWPSVIRSLDPNVKKLRDTPNLAGETLFYRDHCECQYCGNRLTLKEVTMDHVLPVSKGGTTKWNNIVSACTKCNSEKGNNLPKGKWQPRQKPYTPTIWDILEVRRTYPIRVPDESWVPWLGNWTGGIEIGMAHSCHT